MIRFALVACMLAAPMVAQGVVTPRGWDTVTGNVTAGPFRRMTYVVTVQQIRRDMKGRPMTMRQIAFRQGRSDRPWEARARTVELELRMGEADIDNMTRVFANNWIGSPTLAIGRRKVNVPDLRKPPPGGFPAPFDIVLKFDAPWRYSGKNDLCFEFRIFGNSCKLGCDDYPTDAVRMTDYLESKGVPIGLGCVPTGRSRPMTLEGTARSYHDAGKHTLRWKARGGPPLVRSMLLVGLENPNRLVPRLCTYQYVDKVFLGVGSFSDSRGEFESPVLSAPYHPAAVGLPLFAQGYSLDNGRHPGLLPVSATHGLRLRIPPRPPKPVRIWMWGAAQGKKVASGGDAQGYIVELR